MSDDKSLTRHASQPAGSGSTQHSNLKSTAHAKGVNHMPPPAMSEGTRAGYQRSAHQDDVHFERAGPSGPPRGGAGYQVDAHTTDHHGGPAVGGGRADAAPMDYATPTEAEGGGRRGAGPGPNFVEKLSSAANKAEHHPRAGEPHRFDRPPAAQAHGFGHAAHQRSGHLRTSGRSDGHRLGGKKR